MVKSCDSALGLGMASRGELASYLLARAVACLIDHGYQGRIQDIRLGGSCTK